MQKRLNANECYFCDTHSNITDSKYKAYYQLADNVECPHTFDTGYIEYLKRIKAKHEFLISIVDNDIELLNKLSSE